MWMPIPYERTENKLFLQDVPSNSSDRMT